MFCFGFVFFFPQKKGFHCKTFGVIVVTQGKKVFSVGELISISMYARPYQNILSWYCNNCVLASELHGLIL